MGLNSNGKVGKTQLLTLTLCALFITDVYAQDKLYQQDPFDEVTLNTGEVLTVLPIEDFPNRRKPTPAERKGKAFRVRLTNNPDEQFEVQWSAVKSVLLFEERMMREAAKHLRNKNYDEAFEYLAFLQREFPNTPGLANAQQQFLQSEAIALYRQGEFERSWFLLDEIFQMNPRRPGLESSDRAGVAANVLCSHQSEGLCGCSTYLLCRGRALRYTTKGVG